MRNWKYGLFSIFLFGYVVSGWGTGIGYGDELPSEMKVVTDLQQEITKSQQEVDALKKLLDTKKKELESKEMDRLALQEEIEQIDNEVKLTYEKIQEGNREIVEIKQEIEKLYLEIEKLKKELKNREEEFRLRVQTSYQYKFMNYLEVLFEATTFSEMINKINMLKTIMKKDNEVIEEYLSLREELDKKKSEREQLVEKLEQKVKALEEIKASLMKENEENRKMMNGMGNDYKKLLEEYKQIQVKYVDALQIYNDLKAQLELVKSNDYLFQHVGNYGLHPFLEYKRRELVKLAMEKGLHVTTLVGYRSFEEQARLYAQGRTTKGNIVTNAEPGESWHNYGFAFDMAITDEKGVIMWKPYDGNHNGVDDWQEMGEIGMSLGLTWGGTWTTLVDKPHFEYTFGKTLGEMKKLYEYRLAKLDEKGREGEKNQDK